MMNYRLYDWYEGKDLLITSDSKQECIDYAKTFISDTDGECDLQLIDKSGTEYDLDYLYDEFYDE